MLPDKEVKKRFKKTASQNPEKYYATDVLEEEGFKRRQCLKCGTWFWSTVEDKLVCGDASCQGGFSFLENNPASNSLSYVQVWKNFSKQFSSCGYKPVNRFPVIARWNPTTDFTIASIAAFQPFVISGEAKPPAEKLVIPQFCLRFSDVANVGITMSHLTGFVMIGQHQFVDESKWDQNKAFREIFTWLTQGLGLPKDEITFHEDAWAGGGNFGPCMEFFSRGVELGNQVYMMFEQSEKEGDEGSVPLSLKVLDMGMGMERNAWFSQATPTIYDATFPDVISILLEKTKVHYDKEFISSYVPYGAYLNLDEVEDINKAWEDVAKKMDVSVSLLREKLHPMTAIFSIAEHARSLLFALADGGLPSNVGGGYNLRVILRRALSFIEEYNWDIDLADVCQWHANELKDIFPELQNHMFDVRRILDAEYRKFKEGKKRNKQIIENALRKNLTLSTQDLLTFYESNGISPDEFVRAQKELFADDLEQNPNVKIIVPDDFYSLLAQRQEQSEQKTQTKKKSLIEGIDDSLPETKIMYFGDWQKTNFKSKILQVIPGKDKNTTYIVLDQTSFYPTSGGQVHDVGSIVEMDKSFPDAKVVHNKQSPQIIDCIKQGKYVLHLVKGGEFFAGDLVSCQIDVARRTQLTQHHTATHIINGASRAILGDHIWQAGASKSVEKARLDITHFESLSRETLQRIEDLSNEIIAENIPITKVLLPRDEAEAKFGFRLYQGGAVPGRVIRVVEIPGVDVEACGGTHLNNTGEAEKIVILKSTKVQDGIVRIEFVAGEAAKKALDKENNLSSEACSILDCELNQLPARAKELFFKWKKAKKKKLPIEEFVLLSKETFDGDVLVETAKILKTQPEHIVKTIKKFKDQLEEFKSKL